MIIKNQIRLCIALSLLIAGWSMPTFSMQNFGNGPLIVQHNFQNQQQANVFLNQLLNTMGQTPQEEAALAHMLNNLPAHNPQNPPLIENTPAEKISIELDDFSDEDDDGIGCSICLDSYTEDTIIIQFDCNQKVNHHLCLDCVEHFKSGDPCPICRAPIKLHDPCVSKDSYDRVHHLSRSLTLAEQLRLQNLLNSFPLSDKTAIPEPIWKPSSFLSRYGSYIIGGICAGIALYLINEHYQSDQDSNEHHKETHQSQNFPRKAYIMAKYGMPTTH